MNNKKRKFKLVTDEIVEAIHKMKYCSQDGVPNDQKKVIARYYIRKFATKGDALVISEHGHWLVLEDSMFDTPSSEFANGFGKVVFGAVDLGQGLELGDFSIEELEFLDIPNTVVVMDTSFKPLEITVGELRKQYDIDWMV